MAKLTAGDIWGFDSQIRSSKVRVLAGADEAGRGSLAGPLVAAAIIIDEGVEIPGVADSKALSFPERELIYDIILINAISFCIVSVSPWEIDNRGLHKMNLEALRRSVCSLDPSPDRVLVDGFDIGLDIPCQKVIKGDAKSASIAAASIIAKVSRDRIMKGIDHKFPDYGFESHVGYGTAEHLEKLAIHGPSAIHRRSFSGVVK